MPAFAGGQTKEMLMSTRTRIAGAALLGAGVASAFVAWPAPSGAATPRAVAELRNAANQPIGSVTFLGHGVHATAVTIELNVPESAPGLNDFHGLHIHAAGVCDGTTTVPFSSAGGHWDAGGHSHGAHLGDLPSILIGLDGSAAMSADTPRFDVSSLAGRAVVLHAGRDNFNNVPTGAATDQYTANSAAAETATGNTGNAGGRYGCGVIELVGS
jgi:Cu-Zn family superoxide dismutase